MVQIPEEYVKRIIGVFGKKGNDWLNNIDGIAKKYEDKFEIERLHYFKHSVNLILSGYSNKLQNEIILKLCKPTYSIKQEFQMLKRYGNLACKCFYENEEDRVLLLERLNPGFDIRQIEKREDRVKCFAKLMRQTVLEIDDNPHSAYKDRVEQSFQLAMNSKEKYGDTAELVPIAYQYFREIQNLGLKKYLLHGDLGPGNIIKSGNTWKVIDPQGVIGEEIFEVIKFTRGEIENDNNVKQAIEETIYYLSKEIPYSKELIAKVNFIELVRINCWRISENDDKDIYKNVMLAKEVLKYYQENNERENA